jgi:16S rRNA (guanine527-N7)-methyltransferase
MSQKLLATSVTMTKLQAYKSLVTKYHQTLDLVSDVALEHFDEKIADSLAYADVIKENLPSGSTILDVGSGAGLPGLVIASALPHYSVLLVERRQKRATFLKLTASQLGLSNVKVYLADVTELIDIRVNAVTAMAVGTFKLLYCLTRHLHKDEVLLLSRKGEEYEQELEELEKTLKITSAVISNQPLLSSPTAANPANVSRETIYGSLIAVRLLGGLECKGMQI